RAVAKRALNQLQQHGFMLGEVLPSGNTVSLIDNLSSPSVAHREAAQRALLRLGGAVVPDLMDHLRHGTLLGQRAAALGLGLLGERASIAVTALEEAATRPDPLLRRRARAALSQIKLAVLLQDLQSGPPHRQREAVAALREFESQAGLLVPKLTKLVGHAE